MMPAVPSPRHIRVPADVTLKRGWRYVPERRAFVSASGQVFTPGDLPRRTRIVYKTPSLAQADEATLSKAQQDLRRYLQVIFPPGVSPADYVGRIRGWPAVEWADVAPQVSLPSPGSGGPTRPRSRRR